MSTTPIRQTLVLPKLRPPLTRNRKIARILLSVGLELLILSSGLASTLAFLFAPGGSETGAFFIPLSMVFYIIQLAVIPAYLQFLGQRSHFFLGIGLSATAPIILSGLIVGATLFDHPGTCACNSSDPSGVILSIALCFLVIAILATILYLITFTKRNIGFGLLAGLIILLSLGGIITGFASYFIK